MPFPLGGDFPRTVDNVFKVVSSDRRICVNDNGTDTCDAGHKLKFPGNCFNQAIGTFNSTDAAFQPTFPICTVDYESSGFNSGTVFSKPTIDKEHPVYGISGGTTASGVLSQLSKTVQQVYTAYKRAITVSSTRFVAQTANTAVRTYFMQSVPSEISSFWRYAQFNSGSLPRLPGVYSDLFAFDVVGSWTMYNRLVVHMLEHTIAKLKQDGDKTGYKNLVQTDYYTTVSGTVDICGGDEEPPYITYISPVASGTDLRPRDQIVEFSLSDAVGGVDISSIYVSIDSTTSGTLQLLTAGADQTGGDVSITGDPTSYNIRYIPQYLWDYNDTVVVTISGADLPPTVGGNPFFCGAAEVNHFGGDIRFQVLNEEDLPASLTVVGDTSPPYIYDTVPASGTLGNDVFDPISFKLADDLTGVDLTTVEVVVDGETIISEGVPQSSETEIVGTSSEYEITYTKSTAFPYGETITVNVYAEDNAVGVPNVLNTSYELSYITDSTLIIENFTPPVGTSVNLADVDISVDIRDDTYGVDESQSFLVVNGTIVSGTVTTLASGINITYHPPNDFAFDEPITVTVHGTNGNISAPVVKENFYTLFYGCRLFYPNEEGFEYSDRVDVFVRARNLEKIFKDLTTGYFFTSYTQPSSDLGASIEAINPVADLGASLTAKGPEHRYGQTVTVEFYVKDVEGHELGPLTYTYTIEESPE